ncbi:MAG: transcriptional repressor [Candidatus Amulumruptor sp.]
MKGKLDSLTAAAMLRDYMTSRGMRCTGERLRILEAAFVPRRRFSAPELAELLESDGFHVSRTTVYGTLKLLVDSGIVRKTLSTDGTSFYAVRQPNDHKVQLHCHCCGKTKEVSLPEIGREIMKRRYWGFAAESYQLRIDGICSRCKRAAKDKTADRNSNPISQSHK